MEALRPRRQRNHGVNAEARDDDIASRPDINLHTAAHNKTLKRLLDSVGRPSLRYRHLAYSDAAETMNASAF